VATEQAPLNKWVLGANLRSRSRSRPMAFRRPYGEPSIARVEFFGAASGGAAYSLNADPAAFTVSVQAAAALAARRFTASPAAYAFTPSAASVLAARKIAAAPAAFAITPSAVSALAARNLAALPAAFAVTPFGASPIATRRLNATPADFAVVLTDAGLAYSSPSGDPVTYLIFARRKARR